MSHADTRIKCLIFSTSPRLKRSHSLNFIYSLLNYIINDVHGIKHIYHVYSGDKTLRVSNVQQLSIPLSHYWIRKFQTYVNSTN
jgi:hypothetical protein